MATKVAVAGATGNLGLRIVKALTKRDAHAIALVRTGTPEEKLKGLRTAGAQVEAVDFGNKREAARVLDGVGCLVSALQGLGDVILDTQSHLLEAAVEAAVPRFIPSDFATDFRQLPPGENRNFDLRRDFHKTLNAAPIRATSIFNGAFAEILASGTPLLNTKEKSVSYWEDPNWRIDFTTMDDTATYTAAAALDESAPSALHISSFTVSPQELAAAAETSFGTPFVLKRMGSLEELRSQNKRDRAAHPEGEHDLYSSWQQSQYLQSMFSAHHTKIDNDRYPGLKWTSLDQFLREALSKKEQKGAA